jgi:hypothetical protein
MSGGIPLIRKPVLDPTQRAIRDLQEDATALEGAPVPVGNQVIRTAQGADVSTTNIVTRAKSGIYEVRAVLQCTTADAGAGTITLTIGWTDRVGATTTTMALALTATGRNTASSVMQVAGDTNITYAVAITGAYGAALYALELRTLRIE